MKRQRTTLKIYICKVDCINVMKRHGIEKKQNSESKFTRQKKLGNGGQFIKTV